MVYRWFAPVSFLAVSCLLLAVVPAPTAHAQPLPAAASGRIIEAADGDVVVVPDGAQVVVVTRAQAQARLVYVAASQTLLLLTDPAVGFGTDLPDAKGVRRWQMRNAWPLEPRWEGTATIDEYRPFGMAIHTDRGTILIGRPFDRRTATTPPPVAIVEPSSASSRVALGSFDEIERAWLAGGDNALRGSAGGMQMQMRSSSVAGGVSGTMPGSMGSGAPGGPVRVGGNIRPPTRLQFVEPVYPEVARSARVQGVVILELVIGTDGAVSNARVLRSIPLLDQAAIDAVRQWRYEPTMLNGVPTSTIMTATVNFSLPPASP